MNPIVLMKALKCITLGASVMYNIVTYTYIHSNIHIIYADTSVSVRRSIGKFGKDKSSEKYVDLALACCLH